MKLNPEDFEALNNKGIYLDKFGRIEEAMDCYGNVLEINPGHESARKYKEACLQKLQEQNKTK